VGWGREGMAERLGGGVEVRKDLPRRGRQPVLAARSSARAQPGRGGAQRPSPGEAGPGGSRRWEPRASGLLRECTRPCAYIQLAHSETSRRAAATAPPTTAPCPTARPASAACPLPRCPLPRAPRPAPRSSEAVVEARILSDVHERARERRRRMCVHAPTLGRRVGRAGCGSACLCPTAALCLRSAGCGPACV
jgi:hypothetical protein